MTHIKCNKFLELQNFRLDCRLMLNFGQIMTQKELYDPLQNLILGKNHAINRDKRKTIHKPNSAHKKFTSRHIFKKL